LKFQRDASNCRVELKSRSRTTCSGSPRTPDQIFKPPALPDSIRVSRVPSGLLNRTLEYGEPETSKPEDAADEGEDQ